MCLKINHIITDYDVWIQGLEEGLEEITLYYITRQLHDVKYNTVHTHNIK